MIIVDQILQWARDNGYMAVYGSAEQVNEMLTSVPFAEYNDGTVVIMHLIASSETVDGHDRATIAVYFASLCDFDFDGESLLPEQERLKDIGKELLNFIRTGNVLSYTDPRWQYGYDDYAENVAWVCLRVTLTALAADCVPLPEPPTPPVPPTPTYPYNYFCPQTLPLFAWPLWSGYDNPAKVPGFNAIQFTIMGKDNGEQPQLRDFFVDEYYAVGFGTPMHSVITEPAIADWRQWCADGGRPMTAVTEQWLSERIGKHLWHLPITTLQKDGVNYNVQDVDVHRLLYVHSASDYESKGIATY